MRFDIISVLPELLESPLNHSIMKRAREKGLLEVFLRSRGRVLSRARLEDALYGLETEIASNAVEVHIHHLRRKLAREVIVSVRSVGYQLGPVLSRHA